MLAKSEADAEPPKMEEIIIFKGGKFKRFQVKSKSVFKQASLEINRAMDLMKDLKFKNET